MISRNEEKVLPPEAARSRRRALAGVVLAVPLVLSGCGEMVGGWRQSWRTARMPTRHVRLAGAQIPLEVVEGLAQRCQTIPFDIERVGKVRFSHDGFQALIAGQCNVACTSQKIAWYEAKDYREKHGNLPRGWRIAWDAYAIYVHPNNPLKEITAEQFRQIMRGQIKVWSALGGPRDPIAMYGPERSTRGGRLFMQIARLFMADPPWKEVGSHAKVVELVSQDELAMGLAETGHQDVARYLAIKTTLSTFARLPDFDTLESDQWPLAKTIWLWTPDPPDQAATDLIDYLYSAQGQAAIHEVGYTPIPRDRGAKRVVIPMVETTQPGE
jgi:ABC-type phosphate transport system substrate-binding protein